MLKTAKKKLKFWSKNKKPKKIPNPYYSDFPPPPPPPYHCCTCNCFSAIPPSAPPLPPSEHPDEAEIAASLVAAPSYQQYTALNPVYGVPIRVPNSCRSFGRVGDLGIRLIRCICPCSRIPDDAYF